MVPPKVSDCIDTLKNYLECLWKKTGTEKWPSNEYAFSDMILELRLVRGICWCAEKFFLQDLPLESEENDEVMDQTLESFFNDLGDAINKKLWEIYHVSEEISKGLELEDSRIVALFSIFLEALETLKPLCGKVLDKFMYSSQSKLCTVDELLDFIKLFSEDGKEIHSGSSLDSLQLNKLDFLKDFIGFATSQGVGQDKLQDLLALTQVGVITAAFCSYMPQDMEGTTRSFICSQYSEMMTILPIIIVEASRSSSTELDDGDDLLEAFSNSLQKNYLEPLASVQILTTELRIFRNDLGEEGMVLNSLPPVHPEEQTGLDLSTWLEKVQFLKLESGYKSPRTNELPDSTLKLTVLIYNLRSNQGFLDEFLESTHEWVTFCSIKKDLQLVQTICSCLEMFCLQYLTSESDDQRSECSLDCLVDDIHKKAWEIYFVTEEIRKVKMISGRNLRFCSSSFNDVVEILERFLFGKVLDKYMHSTQSKHCTINELLNLARNVSEEGKKFHSGSSLNSLELHKLDFLNNFIIVAERHIEQDKLQDLLAHGKDVVTTAAYYSYVLWKPNVSDSTRRSLIHSHYSEKLKSQEIYIRVLKEFASSCSADYTKMDDDMMKDFIDSLLIRQRELLAFKSNFTVSSMKILMEELRFLSNFFIYKRHEGGDLDEEMTNLIFYVVSEAGIVSYRVSLDDEKEAPSRDTKIGLLNWMEKVQLLKEDVMKKYPETSRLKFPRTNELGFMEGLLLELKELKRYKLDSIAFAHGQIDVVLEDLVFLRDFLQDMVKQRDENEKVKALWLRVVDVAYRFEFVIKSLVVEDPSLDCSPTSFNTVKEEIKKIRAEIEEIFMGKRFPIEAFNTPKTSNHLPSRSSNPTMDEVIVGFEDEAKIIIDRLEAKSAELDIVSLVGMPGRGKTTLAKKVYHDIRPRFLLCAWCCVSQGYQKRNLLLDILNDILGELPTRIDEMSDEDLEIDLYQSLKGRRYLIVLDDIWDIEAWRGLQLCFPDDHNQSRILITSRMHSVGLEVKPDGQPHFVRQLNDDESRELLQMRLFHSKAFPAELQNLGSQIAKSCKGLPLAVVTVAGILATLEEEKWEDFANCLTEESNKLFELSYTHLPDYLKPCLLYFGSFLRNQEIPVSRLIWLWIAEGIVQKTTNEKSLEEVAEDYLKELIDRSLVMVTKRTSRGRVKACSMHDSVHVFCVKKSIEENFLLLQNQEDEIEAEPHRLYLYFWDDYCLCFRHLSSLKLYSRKYYSEVSSIFCSFKILKVLDLMLIDCRDFPDEVGRLVHLRYLALAGDFDFVPSTIVKLWNLETLLLSGLSAELTLPDSLFNMTKLRHVRVNRRVIFRKPEQNLEKCCESSNLETFSTLLLPSGHGIVKIIKKMPYLRKLKCTFLGLVEFREVDQFHQKKKKIELYQFPALDFLSHLESLKVHSTDHVRYPLEFSFPENLKKLTLSNFALPWDSISRFAQLPNLEVLKLLYKACEGETWDMEAEVVFTKLQFLKFENLGIIHWNAWSDNFPLLRQLVLHKCRKLQGIPSSVGEIDTLEIVEVKYCHHSVATSAQDLKEDREGLKTFIWHRGR